MELPNWLYSLQDDISTWLFTLEDKKYPGRFRFAATGSIFHSPERSGLDASALALKISYMLGILDQLPHNKIIQWVDFIRSFQLKTEDVGFLRLTKKTGFFIDPVLIKKADLNMGWKGYDVRIRRAVTRQACAALMCANERPSYPVCDIPHTISQVEHYLSSLDWERDPWGAGSHASHLVFFLKMNKDFFDEGEKYNELIPAIFEWLTAIHNSETGSWYIGDPSTEQKINSAMKILTAYAVLKKPVENPEPLIDFCLASVNQADGCHNADILYVLHYCNQYTKYRFSDIQDFCWERIKVIEKFRKPDGGFSFYLDRSQTSMYGVPITKGLPESDIHGTVLFLWSLKMIVNILGYSDQFNWKMPIN